MPSILHADLIIDWTPGAPNTIAALPACNSAEALGEPERVGVLVEVRLQLEGLIEPVRPPRIRGEVTVDHELLDVVRHVDPLLLELARRERSRRRSRP